MHKRFFLSLVFILLCSFVIAEEKEVLNSLNLSLLTEGERIKFIRIMDDGDVWLFTDARKKENVMMVRKNLFSRQFDRLTLPITQVDYVVARGDGSGVVVYQELGREFWYVDIATGKSTLLSKREEGRESIALLPQLQSFADFVGNHFVAWSSLYDSENRLKQNALLKFPHSQNTLSTKYSELMTQKRLAYLARKYFPEVSALANIEVSERFFTFAAIDKSGRNGKLIAVNLLTEEHFVIDDFSMLLGSSISGDGKYLAYVKQSPQSSVTDLYLYHLRHRKRKKVLSDTVLRPFFQGDTTMLTIGRLHFDTEIGNFYHDRIILIDARKPSQRKEIPLTQKKIYAYWKIIDKGGKIVLFDGTSSFFLADVHTK